MGEISKGVVVALLVVAIVVSVFTTVIMVNTVDNKIGEWIQRPSDNAQVKIQILERPIPVTGQVFISILPQPQ